MASLFCGASHSLAYSIFRFSPPKALVERVISYLKVKVNPPFNRAVDIGCGSGQSTIVLAPNFKHVAGFDLSETQIEIAKKDRAAPNVTYSVADACQTGLEDASVELITVGQALHWLDLPKFFAEVKRILVPNGVLAVYGYWTPLPKHVDENKSKLLRNLIQDHLHDGILGEYWDSKRYDVLRYSYEGVSLPFEDTVKESYMLHSPYSVTDYIGYLTSWSAYQELRRKDQKLAEDTLKDVQNRMMEILDVDTPPEKTDLTVATDFFLLMGRKHS